MATTLAIQNKILVYASRPTEDSFSLSDMLEILYGRIDYYRGMLGVANRNWLVNRFILTVDNSTDEYSISSRAGDFARPILVETYDEVLRDFERRPIDIVQVQNSSQVATHIVNPSNFAVSNYYKHTAKAMAFWGYETSDIKCRVIPQPVQVAEYQVWYEPGKAADPDLQDSPMLMPEFHDLLAVHTAWLGLPNCRWYSKKDYPEASLIELEQMNMSKRDSITPYLQQELQRLTTWFEKYARSNKHERASTRRSFNAYRHGYNRSKYR